MDTPLGRVNAVEAYVQRGDVRYQAAFADLPGDLVRRASSKGVLQGLQQQEAAASKAKIIDVDWDTDLQGIRFVYLNENAPSSRNYYLMRGNRLFLLSVTGQIADMKSDDAARFLSSFQEAR